MGHIVFVGSSQRTLVILWRVSQYSPDGAVKLSTALCQQPVGLTQSDFSNASDLQPWTIWWTSLASHDIFYNYNLSKNRTRFRTAASRYAKAMRRISGKLRRPVSVKFVISACSEAFPCRLHQGRSPSTTHMRIVRAQKA